MFQTPSPKSPATVPPPSECVKTLPVPAPPPPPPSLSLQSKSISKRTKAFHWDLISQDKISKSIWTQCSTEKIKIDAELLYDQFRIQELGTIVGVESATNHQILLNQKVAHNFNIFLKSFDVKPYELKEKVHIINAKDGGLTDEQISSLRRYVPTPDDIEMYKSYKGSPSELHLVDQYMMEMCNIPNLNNRLDLLLTIRELPISVDDLQPLINQMIKMCTQLRNSKSFVSVLKYLLVVGNYLNENAGKEKAKGFRLSSLTKLTQMRGKERKVTLLHALVQQIMLHEPDLAIFFQELTEFETVPGASIKGLTAEVDVLKNELQKIIQHKKVLNKVLNKVNRETQFYKDLKTVLQKYEADLSQLTRKCDEMKKLYSDILVKFGEPQEQDSQELFGWVCSFISNFKKIHEEIIA
ncbi:formin-like protein 13 [Polyodon spathula]|nr:formin-like protein 13 [Polyodon spathula]